MKRENASSADNQQERLKTIGWLVGFTDGEGAFTVSIIKNSTAKTGWQVFPEFVITQSAKSKESLYVFKEFFNCGRVYVNRRYDNHYEDLWRYCVRSLRDLSTIIIPFFKEHSLKTYKLNDFMLFCEAFELIQQGKHLSISGLEEIAYVAMKMNRRKRPKFLESSHTIRRTSVVKDCSKDIVASAWRHAGMVLGKPSEAYFM